MQDLSVHPQFNPQFLPEHEQVKCPRCDSTNTKFCYYNNYNLSQPRHFCKNCRRYWTKGGALRNIPVGGGTRKNTKRSSNPKRSSTTTSTSSVSPSTTQAKQEPSSFPVPSPFDQNRRMIDVGGSFSSLLTSDGQFANFLDGFNPNGSTVQLGGFTDNPSTATGSNIIRGIDPPAELPATNNPDSFLRLQNGGDSSWLSGANGWPDLAMYTPGSSFH